MLASRFVTGDRVSVDWGARGGWRSGRVTAATSELDGVRLHVEYEEPLPRGGWSCRHEQSKTVMRLLAEEVESCELRELHLTCVLSHQRLTQPAKGIGCKHLPLCNYEELLEMSGRECPVFGCGETLRRRSIAIDAVLRAQLLEVPASISSVRIGPDNKVHMQSSGSRGARRQPDPVVHDVDADDQLPILDADELVVVVGTAAEAEEALSEWKLAGLCGTPGCYKHDFHDGVCTPDEVSGSRKRRVRSSSQTSSGQGSSAPRQCIAPAAAIVQIDEVAAQAVEARGEGPQPITAAAAAAAKGLELVASSSNETGFKGVRKDKGKFAARIRENGTQRRLGTFATPEAAALCYARHAGAERTAAEAAEERGEGLQPFTADKARAAAAAEGLELVPSSNNETGFRDVRKDKGKFAARIWENGTQRRLGTFATPEEAALCYARHAGAERAAKEAAEARSEGLQPFTADEARAAAAAEGLELVPSSSNETGFKCVRKDKGKYSAQIKENGKVRHLGNFATPEEAALSYARHVGVDRAAAEAAEANSERLQPLTTDEAMAAAAAVRAAAAAEGLELVPSSSNQTGFRGVCKNHGYHGKYKAELKSSGKRYYLGMFATPEEAALRYARHVGAERAAAEAAEARVEGPQPLTADEARAAEGLELVPDSQ
jgi:hypothetical protein